MNLTKEELMRAILCCITNDCTGCPLSNRHCSELLVLELARNFILKQEKELKICNKALDNSIKINANLQSEIDKLKNKCEDCAGCTSWFCDCANIYQQCVEDIKTFYKENKFAYEAQTLGEELDEFLEEHFKKQENIILNRSAKYDL